jgi:hypothetical protein
MPISDHLKSLEEQLLQSHVRQNSALLNSLIADDFLEFGSSGRSYDKTAIIEALQNELPHPPPLLSGFSARSLSEDIVLVTYRTTRRNPSGDPSAAVQRSSIWIHRDNRWQITFHQGTPDPLQR